MEIVLIIAVAVVVIVVVVLLARLALRSIRPELPTTPGLAATPTSAAPPAARPTIVTSEAAQEVERLIAREQPIAAIKLVREQTGLGLAEAKRIVDTWPSGVTVAQPGFARHAEAAHPAPPRPQPALGGLTPDVAAKIDQLLTAGQQIQAIKAYRTATAVTLQEAKNAIDAWRPRGPLQ